MLFAAVLIAALLPALPAAFAEPPRRSAAVVREFKRNHHCPATHKPSERCPGWIVDHVIPLCAGGADATSNLQWQTVDAARRKDRDERRQCRAMRDAAR